MHRLTPSNLSMLKLLLTPILGLACMVGGDATASSAYMLDDVMVLTMGVVTLSPARTLRTRRAKAQAEGWREHIGTRHHADCKPGGSSDKATQCG